MAMGRGATAEAAARSASLNESDHGTNVLGAIADQDSTAKSNVKSNQSHLDWQRKGDDSTAHPDSRKRRMEEPDTCTVIAKTGTWLPVDTRLH